MTSSHYLPRTLPAPLQGLATLALDLRWSWHHGTDEIWRSVEPRLWDATANPWAILESVGDQRLNALAADDAFVGRLRETLAARQEHMDARGWFPTRGASPLKGLVAYFSMEFALSEALPIYSGGLGVLAADLLKTACDLDVPIVSIGLLYQQGYFRQSLDAGGEQLEFHPYNDPTMLPIVPLRNELGEWVRIVVEFPDRTLRLRIWHAQVGRRSLLLLDSNDLLNEPGDRAITSELYGGGEEMRLQQEIVLGIGGSRLLQILGMDCPIYHLNEGHAAFAILERAYQFMRKNHTTFGVALRATRVGNLFTTHTPVAAGYDRFPPALFAQYFRDYARSLGLTLGELLALGRSDADDSTEPFNMAYLAVRGAGGVNGVSRLHGDVSRHMFRPLFPRWPTHEVPIGHVTNGVHMPTWDSPEADLAWTRACGKARWRGQLEAVETDVECLDDKTLWQLRRAARARLVKFLTSRSTHQSGRRGGGREVDAGVYPALDPDTLTIGFARRFAEYKRPNLLLDDPDRLQRLLCDRDRPVQLVIAGKAHPRDTVGKRLIHQWQQFLARPAVAGRAVFVEDYDLSVALKLTQGVDVWLNTPRRLWEACGTSGMKILVNGGLNLSELDGWWAEAYGPEVGWALGDSREHEDAGAWDQYEAEQLYRRLESEVVPCFYDRDADGMPRVWITRVRTSMARLTPRFSSNRMLREYVERYYEPLAAALAERDLPTAIELEDWHARLARHWPRLRFGSLTVDPTKEGNRYELPLYLHELTPELIRVELYADPTEDAPAECHALQCGLPLSGGGNGYLYSGLIPAGARPLSDYTPRVIGAHPAARVPLEAPFVLWYR